MPETVGGSGDEKAGQMKARADAMLTLVTVMESLSQEDRVFLARDVCNTWGEHHSTHVAKHVVNGRGNLQGGEVASRRRDPKKDQDSLDVLAFLNLKTGKSYRPVEENLRFIRARLTTCSVVDMKGVIARKTREWLNTDMAKYLRPATLFNATRFEQYIGERPPQ